MSANGREFPRQQEDAIPRSRGVARRHAHLSLFSVRILRHLIIAMAIAVFPGCATVPSHSFAPVSNWQTRSGQLLYRNGKTTLIGEVLVRSSGSSNFELTFSKGPGLTLLTLREDTTFAEIKGPLVRGGWSGPIDRAPAHLRGWLGLRETIIHAQNRRSLHSTNDGEIFLLRF
jgi:hypothetical protein